jgi:hypothetical protein
MKISACINAGVSKSIKQKHGEKQRRRKTLAIISGNGVASASEGESLWRINLASKM